jgi:hypothetical protein
MASRNDVDAAAGSNPDGFHASAPTAEPMTNSGHQPGKLVGNDALPVFHAETLPAGTAPPEQYVHHCIIPQVLSLSSQMLTLFLPFAPYSTFKPDTDAPISEEESSKKN